jgi:hypothetical protein
VYLEIFFLATNHNDNLTGTQVFLAPDDAGRMMFVTGFRNKNPVFSGNIWYIVILPGKCVAFGHLGMSPVLLSGEVVY